MTRVARAEGEWVMRILALTNLYPNPLRPHKAAYNRQYFRALVAGGHAVRVIAPVAWTEERAASRESKARLAGERRVESGGIVAEYPRYWYTPGVLRGWYGAFYRNSVRGAFRRAVEEFGPDVVLASWAYPDGAVAVELGHAAGLPVVINVVGSDLLLASGVSQRKAGAAVAAADGVWAVSEDLARKSMEMGAAAGRVKVIYNGVDTGLFGRGDRGEARGRLGLAGEERIVLFAGNLLPVKGVDVLVEALGKLKESGVRNTCYLIGQGPMRAELEARAAALGLAERVRFMGSVSHERLPDWFRAADLFVLPSRSEGVPNVLLEAFVSGTRYVATRVGGIPEVAEWGTGELVAREDAAGLAAAIARGLEAGATGADEVGGGKRWERSFADAAAEVAGFLGKVLGEFRSGTAQARLALAGGT